MAVIVAVMTNFACLLSTRSYRSSDMADVSGLSGRRVVLSSEGGVCSVWVVEHYAMRCAIHYSRLAAVQW